MKINVTAEHIAHGVRKVCDKCPVALAIKEAIPAATYVMAGTGVIDITLNKVFKSYEAPESVREFIVNFDRGIKPHLPFSFELPL